MLPTALIELTNYKQFVCWKTEYINERKTKVPYNPVTGYRASSTDPNTWTDYYTAMRAIGSYDGIGFVLSKDDPYLFIDLDKTGDPLVEDQNLEIAKYLNTYTEYSPNGGLHAIGKGSVPKGKKNCHREIYSSERYMTITGNALHHLPIRVIEPSVIASFYDFLHSDNRISATNYQKIEYHGIQDSPQVISDDDVWYQIMNSSNCELFMSLWNGNIGHYPSNSEADMALMNILAFHTRNNEQAIRIFRYSALAQRAKAWRDDYMQYTLRKARDQQAPNVNIIYPQDVPLLAYNSQAEVNNAQSTPIDVEAEEVVWHDEYIEATPLERVQLVDTEQQEAQDAELNYDVLDGIGLIKDVASYLYEQSPRKSKIFSLTNAIGLMAGITGRKFNVSKTGLNLYLLMLGDSGSGKEGPRTGVTTLMSRLHTPKLMSTTTLIPEAAKFIASTFAASGQGLLKQLAQWPCFLSFRDEFGGDLERIYRRNANAADRAFKDALLAIFSKSGREQMMEGIGYSDQSKNIGMIHSPAMSVLFTSVPDRVYEQLSISMMSDGFLPRFLIFEETGETKFNDSHDIVEPSQNLISKMSALCNTCLHEPNVPIDIAFSENAEINSKRIRDFFEEKAKKSKEDGTSSLWERAHLKVLKLAALSCFHEEFINPVITDYELDFAFKVVQATTNHLIHKFVNNTLGIDDSACIGHIQSIVDKLLSGQVTLQRSKDSITYKFLLDNGFIPYALLSQRALSKAPFKAARDGPANALKRILSHLESCGYLLPTVAPNGSSYKGKVYVRGTK